jgi:hypothetical protein
MTVFEDDHDGTAIVGSRAGHCAGAYEQQDSRNRNDSNETAHDSLRDAGAFDMSPASDGYEAEAGLVPLSAPRPPEGLKALFILDRFTRSLRQTQGRL